jgi:hypothetical protein
VPVNPDTSAPPRFVTPCGIRRERDNGSSLIERFARDGRPLETTDLWPGEGTSHTTHHYEQGREVLRLTEVVSRQAGDDIEVRYSDRLEWTYDSAGRVVRYMARLGHPRHEFGEVVTLTFYDAQGRLDHAESRKDGRSWRNQLYHYDTSGRVESVLTSDVGDSATRTRQEQYTYHPNGQLGKRHSVGLGVELKEQWDEAGRFVDSYRDQDGDIWTTRNTYDSEGRLIHTTASFKSRNGRRHDLTTTSYVYDEAGRVGLRHLHEAGRQYDSTYDRRYTLRSTYTCSGDLVLEERDDGDDGTSDGRHELERDPAGNLLVERFSGTWVEDDKDLLREYDYSCH